MIGPEMVGHDFWLTRNRHGAGFRDRGLGELGDRLTALSHPYGTQELYVGDDGIALRVVRARLRPCRVNH